MGGFVSACNSNDELIDRLVEAELIRTPLVQQVFRAVDRANYYCRDQKDNAYRDIAWKMGNLHLSAPWVYAVVMEALELKPGVSFLNLGSGSGYFSTMAGLILGVYGINHGIELHKEIVEFAKEKLNDFIENASAVDEYDFCEPSFFVGNCFLLDNCQQYDRVYCGASCPKEYETYIKNLVKVGGILIMPLNEKLLKITRNGESTWTTTKVLSVSFASLITPPSLAEHEHAKYIKLDTFCPPKMKDICCSNIREILRKNIDKDYPNLKNKSYLETNDRREVRHVNIPEFDDSDWSNSQSNSHSEYDSDDPESTINSDLPLRICVLLDDFLRRHTALQAVNETLEMQSHSSSSDSDIKPGNDKENCREDPKNKTNSENKVNSENKTKSEKKEKSESKANSEKLTYSASFISMSDDSLDSDDFQPSSSKKLTSDELKQTRNHTYRRTQIRRRKPSARVLKKRKLSRKKPASETRARVKHRNATTVSKRIFRSYSDSETEEDSKNDNIAKEKDNVKKDIENEDTYTKHMIKRIAILPLPTYLKKYLDYKRNNL